ncbi:hypothetical protein HZC34_06165 [Candidatus Saganbacteria bacterium]|nr:hypothetical protein [Candidatus Saganbacteria bacterium]
MNKEAKKYFVDIFARMSQVIFTLAIVSPFFINLFSLTTFIFGGVFFGVIVFLGYLISNSISEG